MPLRLALELLQINKSGPAFTKGEGVMNTTVDAVAAGHTPLLAVLKLIITEPADMAPAPGVKKVLKLFGEVIVLPAAADHTGVADVYPVILTLRAVDALFAHTVAEGAIVIVGEF